VKQHLSYDLFGSLGSTDEDTELRRISSKRVDRFLCERLLWERCFRGLADVYEVTGSPRDSPEAFQVLQCSEFEARDLISDCIVFDSQNMVACDNESIDKAGMKGFDPRSSEAARESAKNFATNRDSLNSSI
jgi:hypothetical protein